MHAQVVANFFVHYEIDGETAKHHLLLEQYGGQENGCWMLLKEKEASGPEGVVVTSYP